MSFLTQEKEFVLTQPLFCASEFSQKMRHLLSFFLGFYLVWVGRIGFIILILFASLNNG